MPTALMPAAQLPIAPPPQAIVAPSNASADPVGEWQMPILHD
jgi:hypothetical protein